MTRRPAACPANHAILAVTAVSDRARVVSLSSSAPLLHRGSAPGELIEACQSPGKRQTVRCIMEQQFPQRIPPLQDVLRDVCATGTYGFQPIASSICKQRPTTRRLLQGQRHIQKKLSVLCSKPCSRIFSDVWIRCMQQRNHVDAHLERSFASCRSAAKLAPYMSLILKITQRENNNSTRLCSVGLIHMTL